VSGAGSHTLTFWSTDIAGNLESAHSVSFSIGQDGLRHLDLAKPDERDAAKPFVLSGVLSIGTGGLSWRRIREEAGLVALVLLVEPTELRRDRFGLRLVVPLHPEAARHLLVLRELRR